EGEFAFHVKAGEKHTRFKAQKNQKVTASTFDEQYKWGPIDLQTATEYNFYWKLTMEDDGDK
ncbi:MAG: hypothetical protein HC896_10610, partial [Bacteroidales bacterium]|nr:hypothetical protein [Bacteroidales bacterium]